MHQPIWTKFISITERKKLFSEGFWIYIDYQIELMIFQNWFEGFGESLKRHNRDGFALGGGEKTTTTG